MTMRMSISPEQRYVSRSMRQAGRAWIRLFLIEMRRSSAVWAAVVIALVTWWLMRDWLRVGVVRWRDMSFAAGDPLIPISAIAAGMSAFVAGRDRRGYIAEQIHVTSTGRMSRDLSVMLPVLVWCLLGYVGVVAGYFAYAANGATWGGPIWAYVLIPTLSIVMSVALGWLVGIVFHNRLTPIIALGLTLLLQASYPATQHYRMDAEMMPNGKTTFHYGEAWWRMLVPWEIRGFSEEPTVITLGVVWLAGLAVFFWCVSGWLRFPSQRVIIVAVLALVVATGSAFALVSGNWVETTRAAYVEPVCTSRQNGQISVCVHPQDASLLNESADVIAHVLAPLAGLSGLPTEYMEMQDERIGDGPVYFSLYDQTTISNLHLQQGILRDVLQGPDGYSGRVGSAQYVIGSWLLQEAGIDPQRVGQGQLLMPLRTVYGVDADVRAGVTDPMAWEHSGPSPDEYAVFVENIHAAIDRFAALSPEAQHAWLSANWDDLMHGRLTLEDLP